MTGTDSPLPFRRPEWARLEALARAPRPPIADLFATEPERLQHTLFALAGIRFDGSKLPIDCSVRAALLALAEAIDLPGWLAAVAGGAIVNPSEGRAATHMALRDPAHAPRHAAMFRLADAIRSGALGPVAHLVHIGIGGSALGPALLLDALGRDGDGPQVHVVANIDGEALARALGACDPGATLLVAVSKTFTTQETLLNLRSASAWLAAAGLDPPERSIAVTAAPDRAAAWGIAADRILGFDESVGGRYSLWSAVGLPLAVRSGPAAFRALLDGAHAMDRHVLGAPPARNAAIRAALADLWQAVFLGRPTRAVFAYDERLRLLPAYLQQLEMESNGKSTARDGTPLPCPSAPVTWGGTGTDAQHAVFQLLHQGTHADPVEFVAVREPGHAMHPDHHRLLLANCFAQGAALMAGRAAPAGGDPALAAQRAFAGNRPSSTILLDRLDPATLGALLAFYEARTIALAALMGINPFDQWGVELGKAVAAAIAAGNTGTLDPSTAALMAAAGLDAR